MRSGNYERASAANKLFLNDLSQRTIEQFAAWRISSSSGFPRVIAIADYNAVGTDIGVLARIAVEDLDAESFELGRRSADRRSGPSR
jgi:hypothetical protein